MEEKIEDLFFKDNPDRASWDRIGELEINSNIIEELHGESYGTVDERP
jgi:hypothetical protein